MLQTRLAPYLNEVVLDANESGQVFVNFSVLNTVLDNQKIANPAAALADLIELNKYAGTVLQENSWTGLDMLRSWIDQNAAGTQTQSILQDLGVSIIERGASPDDIVFSSANNTNISGLASNDVLYGGGGRDWLTGGDGDDVLRGDGIYALDAIEFNDGTLWKGAMIKQMVIQSTAIQKQ